MDKANLGFKVTRYWEGSIEKPYISTKGLNFSKNFNLNLCKIHESMLINYNKRAFRAVQNSENGETSAETIFHYYQEANILTAEYAGGKIIKGHLIGLVDQSGKINMRYHQVNSAGELMTGICHSIPEIMENGKIRLHEIWEWTSGDLSKGESVIEEI